jgi:hypothetical protein
MRTARRIKLLEALLRNVAAANDALRALIEELDDDEEHGSLRDAETEPPPPPSSMRGLSITPAQYQRFAEKILRQSNTKSQLTRLRVLIEQGREMGLLEAAIAEGLLEQVRRKST